MIALRKILCVCVMAAVLVMAFPVSSLAVDPVSAATMANAFAQAITAYGASQGVSMMFDISNTSQIGEQIHELWKRFRSDQQTADDYETIAAAIFPSLYYKVMRAAGSVVGIKLAAEYVADLDGFWNWLLSGPAEMQKVDNQYYEFSNNQSIPVIYDSPFNGLILPETNPINYNWLVDNGIKAFHYDSYDVYIGLLNNSSSVDSYPFFYEDSGLYRLACVMNLNDRIQGKSYSISYTKRSPNFSSKELASTDSTLGLFYVSTNEYYNTSLLSNIIIPIYSTLNDGLNAVASVYSGGLSPIISVRPYIGDTAPQDVYIPDNEDVNYVPIPADIPLDIPWDDTLYGDGQVLTDAQSIEIADALDLAISDTETLELAESVDVPADPPSEVYIPLLPVELPSFNFSLSGIWHYVVSWVQSLGAWLSLMFQTWAVLPSAITIPVYATAVIVIVLGVYKRFFM